MRIKVIKPLNTRVGGAHRTFQKGLVRLPGEEIEVAGMVKGEEIDGNSNWFIEDDVKGNHYWSGGGGTIKRNLDGWQQPSQAQINLFKQKAKYPPTLINWNEKLPTIPKDIKANYGKNISIAVLDRGVDKNHLDLNSVIDSIDFTNDINFGALDRNGHGTAMCSFIGSKSFFADRGVNGIAPMSKIYSAKVIYGSNNPRDGKSLTKGLQYAIDNNVDIINMSIGGVEKTDNIFSTLTNLKDIICLASVKQFSDEGGLMQFPASHPSVIPVAAMPKDFLDSNWNNLPTPLVIIPYMKSWCASIADDNFFNQEEGSSVATAFISGITGLLLSSNPLLKRDKNSILNELSKYSKDRKNLFDDLNNIYWTIKF